MPHRDIMTHSFPHRNMDCWVQGTPVQDLLSNLTEQHCPGSVTLNGQCHRAVYSLSCHTWHNPGVLGWQCVVLLSARSGQSSAGPVYKCLGWGPHSEAAIDGIGHHRIGQGQLCLPVMLAAADAARIRWTSDSQGVGVGSRGRRPLTAPPSLPATSWVLRPPSPGPWLLTPSKGWESLCIPSPEVWFHFDRRLLTPRPSESGMSGTSIYPNV